MKAKYIIASIGILGYLAYMKLSRYLKESTIETFNFLRAENGETFFLGIDVTENTFLKIPILKWNIYKIKLIVNKQTIAISLPVTAQENNFVQEFKANKNANFETIKTNLGTSIIEITYKTVAGLKITHQYTINNFNTTEEINNNQNNTDSTNNQQQQAQTCTCEPIKTPIK